MSNPVIQRVLKPTQPGEQPIVVDLVGARLMWANLAFRILRREGKIPRPVYQNLAKLMGSTLPQANQALRDLRRCPDVLGTSFPINADGELLFAATEDSQSFWEERRKLHVIAEATTVRESDRKAAIQLGYAPLYVQVDMADPRALPAGNLEP